MEVVCIAETTVLSEILCVVGSVFGPSDTLKEKERKRRRKKKGGGVNKKGSCHVLQVHAR